MNNPPNSAPQTDRQEFHCTPDNLWSPEKDRGQRVRHLNTYEVGEQEDGWPSGDIIRVRCRNCGTEWKEELPQ